jgi:hypothetical protein
MGRILLLGKDRGRNRGTEKLINNELYKFCSLPDITEMIKLRTTDPNGRAV